MRKLLTFLIAAAVTVGASLSAFGAGLPFVLRNDPLPISAAPPSFSLIYESSVNSTSHTATVDYGTMTYGSGCTRVIVSIAGFGAASVSSISVNGVGGATVTGSTVSQGGGNFMTTVWETSSSVSGSSGDVQVTYSAAITDNSAVALYCLVTTTPTASSGQNTSTGRAASISQSITVPSGGGAVAIGAEYINGFISFTNATSDATVGTSGSQSMLANFGHLTSTGSISVTANASSGSQFMNLSLAAWGP
jgi:hypothetical protein